MATLVKFYKIEDDSVYEDNSIIAFFPQLIYCKMLYGNTLKVSYQTVGHHSACSVEFIKGLKPSDNYEECLPLITELKNIGYDLKILNKWK